jgi:hypothetical protein
MSHLRAARDGSYEARKPVAMDGRSALRAKAARRFHESDKSIDRNGGPPAASDTAEPGGNPAHNYKTECYLTMQSDGNLVLYSWFTEHAKCGLTSTLGFICPLGWYAVWSSETNGNPGAHLEVQNDGNVVIYASNGATPLWSMWYGRSY